MKRCYLEKWFLAGSVLMALFSSNLAAAQVVGDTTMPLGERSQVSGNPNFQIDGGARRGGNLFHSFSQFSVQTGGSAFFNNAADVQNILTRVTGGTISNIDGVIRANGTANLFLLNPSGIIFGKNASLNIGGSFVATTANAIGFGNLGFFSASAPETPSPLLTINPSALLFNQIAAAPIQNNSTAPAGTTLAGADAFGLRVRNGRSLLLVGGNISLDGGQLNAFGGRVELGGLASAGTVGLNVDGNNLSLSFPDSVARSDVFLSNGAQVNVFAGNGGSIAVTARNLEMTGQSFLAGGIEYGQGSNTSQAGNISVNATGAINLDNMSAIAQEVQPRTKGQGGDINISASTLRLEGGSQIYTAIYSVGKGGNLTIDAQDVQIIGQSADQQLSSALGAVALPNSTGDAGNLTIKTNTLLARDGGDVSTTTYGAGKGGALSIDAQSVQLIGTGAQAGAAGGLFASAARNSTGDAGDLTIKTNTLLVRDGAVVYTATSGAGKGGALSIDAQDVQLIGASADDSFSGLSTSAARNSTGDAGDLTIKTNTLLVRDGSQVLASTNGAGKGGALRIDAQDVQLIGTTADGQFSSSLGASAELNSTGNAGSLTIKTNTLLVRDGAQVSTTTSGAGKGGSLSIDAQDVQLIGTTADGQAVSGLFSDALPNSTGDAGNLTIKTNTLLVRDGAKVVTSTFGPGKGGDLRVDAQVVQIIGESAKAGTSSSLTAATELNSTGDAGDLTIKTNTLLLQGGAQVNTATFAAGKGGDLRVDAQDVQLIGTGGANGQYPSGLGASALLNSTGDAGDLTVKTNTLLVQDGATVTVESLGTGTAGNLTLDARSIRLDNDGSLSASTRSPKVDPNREQATININSQALIMTRGSNIETNATGANVIGGNINIDADVLAGVDNSDITANSASFRGGNVRIDTQGIFGIQFRDVASPQTSDITATGATNQLNGNVQITRPDVDPASGLVQLPADFVDRSGLIAQGCRDVQGSSFVASGRGGLPPTPQQALGDDPRWRDWRPPAVVSRQPNASGHGTLPPSANPASTKSALVEATGWVIEPDGKVILTASAPNVTFPKRWGEPVNCDRS